MPKTTPYLLLIALPLLCALAMLAHACGGQLNVGKYRSRASAAAGGEVTLESFSLKALNSFTLNASPSPAWAPNSRQFAYADANMSRLMLFNVDNSGHQTLFEANAPQNNSIDARYNVASPAFINDFQVATGPFWFATLAESDPWTFSLVHDTSNNVAPLPLAPGGNPRPRPGHPQILLEAANGLRLVSTSGTEERTYPNLCRAKWHPEGERFAAIRFNNYCEEGGALVLAEINGDTTFVDSNVAQFDWHPSGAGIAVLRAPANVTFFSPNYHWGSIHYIELGENKSRLIADRARSPVFLPRANLLLFDTPNGLGVSDLVTQRVLREPKLTNPTPSPNGRYLVGESITWGGYAYYPTIEVTVYEVN